MNVLLIDTKINGIKCIDKEIAISFAKKNFGPEAFEQSYIKTIYGSNGSGKSAIVHAFDIYRFLVTNEFPFKDQVFLTKLLKLINKRTNEFTMENTFAVILKDQIHRYRHYVALRIDPNKNITLCRERLLRLNPRLDVSRCVFDINDGELEGESPFRKLSGLNAQTNRQNSLIQSLMGNNYIHNPMENELERSIVLTYYFALNLDVSYGSADNEHDSVQLKSVMEHLSEPDFTIAPSLTKALMTSVHKLKGDHYAWVIRMDDEPKYVRLTKNLCKFLQLLTPKLKDIVIDFIHDGSFSYCKLRFVYEGYDVDYEFESTGVKKLCSIFVSLSQIDDGRIVIIDEIDAGIHDTFLTALIEYFALYNHCQIIMTTHHVGLMDVVKHIAKSISILTDDHRVIAWVKDGDSSPSSLYKKGYLEGVPFNLKPFDFAEVFAIDEDQQ